MPPCSVHTIVEVCTHMEGWVVERVLLWGHIYASFRVDAER